MEEGDYTAIQMIGKGAFGEVHKGVLNKTGQIVAIKVIKRGDTMKEWNVMARLAGHQHILRPIALVEGPKHVAYVLEFAKGGDLFSYLGDKGFEVPEEDVRTITRQIVAALLHINACGVAHLDLKLENVLFKDASHSHVLLADFGAAEVLGESSAPITRPVGTPQYMAPEVLRCCRGVEDVADDAVPRGFGMRADNWSLGVLVYVLLHGCFPFAAAGQPRSPNAQLQKILETRSPFTEAAQPSCCSKEAHGFISKLLQISPAHRMTLAEAREHPWLRGAQTCKHDLDDLAAESSSAQGGKRPRLG
ncbi:kinase-like domain-containing protein [Syncephalis pseudoplumigaleata]|uniref:Kinase-like domain-containing protein n=1 Tax=Syncephalis pseudoplumigaleata TaxID=1712513 RepID=A0A4P9YTN2_9FUNG|nr:kinase-like domain-containing protein [Syncephalis pseudoplumigaleata]|eukprot:RKP22521.1 kinase-like domain-containing protein [Syncephalis pseudoplumigaleata]